MQFVPPRQLHPLQDLGAQKPAEPSAFGLFRHQRASWADRPSANGSSQEKGAHRGQDANSKTAATSLCLGAQSSGPGPPTNACRNPRKREVTSWAATLTVISAPPHRALRQPCGGRRRSPRCRPAPTSRDPHGASRPEARALRRSRLSAKFPETRSRRGLALVLALRPLRALVAHPGPRP